MLVEIGGAIINTNHVIRVVKIDKNENNDKCRIVFSDGVDQILPISAYDVLEAAGKIVPNTGGYAIVMTDGPDRSGKFGPRYWTVPVLAFRVTARYGMPSPITAEGEVEHSMNEWALLGQDGRCHFDNGKIAKNIRSWIDALDARPPG